MAHKIVFNVAPKDFGIQDCVRLTPSKNYQDVIQKDFEYTGESQVTVSFTNVCTKPFTINPFILFTNTENGGNFEARIQSFSIGNNQTIDIPVRYYGICKSDLPQKNYIISLNGVSANYKLIIQTVVVNTPPVITTVELVLENRADYVFQPQDFLSHYSDAENHSMASILLEGDLSAFRLNGNTLTSPAEVAFYDLQNGGLKYVSQNTDNEINVVVTLKAKDELGAVSN